jgi:4-amino-4-deoxy-L-arabinose transferase-like glycosyltransferase
VAGPSLVALRLTGVLAGMATVVIASLCARELGGGARGQALAAGGFLLTPYCLGIGAIFHPTMFDALSWATFTYLALRILRRPEPRSWPWLGVVAGVGLETKGTMVALIGSFILGVLILGPRRVLYDRRVGLTAAIAIAGLVPYLGWEAAHGWPSVTFLPSQDAATAASVSRPGYMAQQLAFLGGTIVLVGAGVRELWRDPRLRALAVLAPVTSLLFLVEQGRSYYSLPAIVLPLAAGAVATERWAGHTRRRRMIAVAAPVVVLQLMALALAAPLVWPVLPTATMIASGDWSATYYKDELGWPELATATGHAWRSLPATQRTQTALLADNYGEAGALDLYGPGHRQRGTRPDDRRLRTASAARAPVGRRHRPRHALGPRRLRPARPLPLTLTPTGLTMTPVNDTHPNDRGAPGPNRDSSVWIATRHGPR